MSTKLYTFMKDFTCTIRKATSYMGRTVGCRLYPTLSCMHVLMDMATRPPSENKMRLSKIQNKLV